MQEGRRFAILVGNSQYDANAQLENLRCPVQDATGLAEILNDPQMGHFDHVQTFINRPHNEILATTEQLISNEAAPNDLILFYFSGHGKLDRQGRLYLAVANTHAQTLGSTAIPLAQLKDFIDNGRSTRLVIILDCCFSGAAGDAFATPKGDIDSPLQLLSGGRGKYILTASTASQTAQEKESDTYSVFTKHLIAGLRTGAADLDRNGRVTVEELYRYIYTQVREENYQEPMQWGLDRAGDLVLAFCSAASDDAVASAISLPSSRYDYDAVIQMFRQGTVIPFLGPGVWAHHDDMRPPLNGELAQQLTMAQDMPEEPVSLVAQKIDMVSGRGVVYGSYPIVVST